MMDEENQINDKLKTMKFSLLPCGIKHTPFFKKIQTIFIYNKLLKTCNIKIAYCGNEQRIVHVLAQDMNNNLK